MRPRRSWIAWPMALALVAVGCAPAPTPPLFRPTNAPPATGPAATVAPLADAAALEAALTAGGITWAFESEQDLGFLDVPGRIYRLAGEDSLEVHTYADAATAQAVSQRVAPNGRVIRDQAGENVAVEWLGTPHFFRSGPLIVVYVGTSPATLDVLTRALGPPFAGG